MSQLTMDNRTRSRRRPRPRVSWGATATSAGLRADRRRAMAAASLDSGPRPAAGEVVTLAELRDRVVAAVRPLLDDARRSLAAAAADLTAQRGAIPARRDVDEGDETRDTAVPERRVLPRGWLGLSREGDPDAAPTLGAVPLLSALLGDRPVPDPGAPSSSHRRGGKAIRASGRRPEAAPRP